MYILRGARGFEDKPVYLTIEHDPSLGAYPLGISWTFERAEAVRFMTKYQPRALAKKIGARVVRISP